MTVARARTRADRLVGVDAARGVALIGMIAVHVQPAIGPDGTISAAYLAASGRASALFALLAGVGLALASGGRSVPQGRVLTGAWASTAARALILMVVGLAVGAADSGVAVILVYYALLFLVAIPFLGLRPAVLLPMAIAWAILSPFLSQLIRLDEPWSSPGNPTFESLGQPVDLVASLTVTGYYPVLTWTSYLLLGLAIGRMDLRALRTQRLLLAVGVAGSVAAWLASRALLHVGVFEQLQAAGAGAHPAGGRPLELALQTSLYGTTPTTSWWWLAVAAPHSGAPLDLLHTMGAAIAVLGLMLLAAHRLQRLLWPLAAVGSMTLTLYSVHVVLLGTVLDREIPHALLWHLVVAFAIAIPWRAFVGRGPLETVAFRAATAARNAVTSGRERAG